MNIKKEKIDDNDCQAEEDDDEDPTATPSPTPSTTPSPTPSTTPSEASITSTIILHNNGLPYNDNSNLIIKITCDIEGKNCVSDNAKVTVSENIAILPKDISITGYNISGWAKESDETSNFVETITIGENKTYNYYLIGEMKSKKKYIYNYISVGSCNSNKKKYTVDKATCRCYSDNTAKLEKIDSFTFNAKYISGMCEGHTNDCVLKVGAFTYQNSNEPRPELDGRNTVFTYDGIEYHSSYAAEFGYNWYYYKNEGSSHKYTLFSDSDRKKYLYHSNHYEKMYKKEDYKNEDGEIDYEKACNNMCVEIWNN